MTDSGLKDGNSGQILVSHYLVERHQQVDWLLNASKKRKREINASKEEGEVQKRVKRPIGRLHYRTRSHKSYKIPRKIRSNKRKPSSVSSTIDQKRCRKHRRRNSTIPANTYIKQGLSDHSTQPVHKLANHVWYAKRMKMDRDYYGWQIPLRSNARGLKSLEKLVQRKALLYDYSYYHPIKLSLSQNVFSRFLTDYTDPDCDLCQSLSKITNKEGYAREFELLLYESGRFPEGLIGPITLTIRFGQRLEVICWSHPSIRSTVLTILQSLSQETDVISLEENVPLARLWLSGEEVHDILLQVLNKNSTEHADSAQRNSFLYHTLSDERRLKNVWKTGQILSHNIRDPRLLNASLSSSGINHQFPQPTSFHWPKMSGESPLWSSERLQQRMAREFPLNSHLQRLIASQRFKLWNSVTRLAQQTFSFPADGKTSSNKKNQNNGTTVPADSSTSDIDSVPEVPLLLIRRSNNEWIVILPRCDVAGFHYLFTEKFHLLSLGLQEMNVVLHLHHTLVFPNDYPDTLAGIEYWKRFYHEERIKKEERKPKAKRDESILTHSPYSILQRLIEPLNHSEEEEEEENTLSNRESGEEFSDRVENEDKMDEDDIQETGDENLGQVSENDDDLSASNYHERFLVVRDRKYYNDVIPPKYEVSNVGGIVHCLRHSDWQYEQSFPPQENDLITPLPATPKPIFLFLNLFPTSRGVPITGSLLFQPSISDVKRFLQHKIHFKLRRIQKKKERESSSSSLPTIVTSSASAASSAKRRKLKQQQKVAAEQRRRAASFDQSDDIPQYDPQLSNEWQGVNLFGNSSEIEEEEEERVLVGIVTNGFPRNSNTNAHINQQRTGAVAMVNIQLMHQMITERYGRYSHPLTHLLLLFQSPRSQWLRPAIYEFR